MLASVLKRDLKNLIQRDASPNFQAQNGLLSLRSWWRSVRSLRIPPKFAYAPDLSQAIGLQPERETLGVESFEDGAVPVLADQDRTGMLGERREQRVGVRRDDELSPFSGIDEQFGQQGDRVGMEAEFGLLDADQRRRRGRKQEGEDRHKANGPVRQTSCWDRCQEPPLVQVELHRTALNTGREPLITWEEQCQQSIELSTGVDMLDLVEEQAEVPGVGQ